MNSRQLLKWSSFLLMVSVLLVWGAWASHGRARELVNAIAERVYLPALYVAISLSTRDDISEVFMFAAFVVQTFLMLLAVWGAVAAVMRLKAGRT